MDRHLHDRAGRGWWLASYEAQVGKLEKDRVDAFGQLTGQIAAIREGREPNSSVAQVLPCYKVLHDLEQQF